MAGARDVGEVEAVSLLKSIVGAGADAVAVLSLLVNIYLWRALRASEAARAADKDETIRMLRAELERTKTSDTRVLSEIGDMVAMIRRQGRPGGGQARIAGGSRHVAGDDG